MFSMSENGDESNSPLVSSITPVNGMKFKSEEDAYCFYNIYARVMGFSIRKHYKSRGKKDNKILWRIFCCSCQGERERHPNGTPNKPRAQTRFNCLAQMRIDLEKSAENYVISEFVEEHNHELTDPDKVYFLRSHRKISPAQKCLIKNMSESGIGSSEIFYHCSKEAGGFEHLGFTQTDCDNVVQRRRIEFLKKGDGQLLVYFRQKKKENKSFFYRFQLNEDTNQISNCFWCDAQSRIDYQCFGDVVCFDTTYNTNEYDMPFAPFVGVNNHRQTVIFAGALLSDEKAETFVWLFKTFLEAMGGKVMDTIFTDQAPSIVKAIREVFPSSHHRLCIWHIYQNALRNLSHVFTAFESFRLDFTKCIYEAETEDEFKLNWDNLLSTYNLKENKWLLNLYEVRFKWAQVYAHEYFCAGMASTQRSESINNYFKKYFKRKQILREFMDQYDRVVSLRRQKEANAYVKSKITAPILSSTWPMEKLASKFYTQKMFRRFQEQLQRAAHELKAKLVVETSAECTYHVNSYSGSRIRTVQLILSSLLVKCTCKSGLSNIAQDVVKEGSLSEELNEIACSGLKWVLDELKSYRQSRQGDVTTLIDSPTQIHDQESGDVDDLGVNITLEAPTRKRLKNKDSDIPKGFYTKMKNGKSKPQRRKKDAGEEGKQGQSKNIDMSNQQTSPNVHSTIAQVSQVPHVSNDQHFLTYRSGSSSSPWISNPDSYLSLQGLNGSPQANVDENVNSFRFPELLQSRGLNAYPSLMHHYNSYGYPQILTHESNEFHNNTPGPAFGYGENAGFSGLILQQDHNLVQTTIANASKRPATHLNL